MLDQVFRENSNFTDENKNKLSTHVHSCFSEGTADFAEFMKRIDKASLSEYLPKNLRKGKLNNPGQGTLIAIFQKYGNSDAQPLG
jgi:hypothetical protein